ncbi:MAG: putative quinol monooxygenase [bacterium]|nr:putative quinol monooxygenase [bacterium]
MHILQVFIRVKPDSIEPFKAATIENVRASRREPGVLRFDMLQQADDPSRITLIEIYRAPEDHARHRETPHYQAWRSAVEGMMAEPRRGVTYVDLQPDHAARA